ncbi:hypothetical protein GALMADRAFT_141445 [Galerina marginata CBS 339.88]|uniref:Uncharacterized protein n=1 Tax=Galerina marginata (strain CBS 339.88) TaxID=685588 RepID=A0A067T5X4_GALM3|nr:hypothetical protein GALMADRAFT_141445 [Galerina marginata CBS 339.88]
MPEDKLLARSALVLALAYGPGAAIPWRRKAAVEDRRMFVMRAAVDDQPAMTATILYHIWETA